MLHIPIMKFVLRRSGSVNVDGTSPVKISLRAFLLKIALPFSNFSSPYFSRYGLIFERWPRYSHTFSMLPGWNLSYGTRFSLHNLLLIGKAKWNHRDTVLSDTIVPVQQNNQYT